MTFLSPWTAFLAAAVAIPLLLLLYFLKLRRRTLRIASTLLWRKSFEDLQVNVPFQRLRFSILLLLQGLLILLLLLALAEPVVEGRVRPAPRMILLIDRSASMSATDAGAEGDQSRLEAAKAAARRIVDRLSRSSESSKVMIIAFGSEAELACGFEARRDVLIEAINGIGPTDEEANLPAALELASVFAGQAETDAPRPPDVVLISDGGVGEPEDEAGFSLRGGDFRFVFVGPGRQAGEGETPAPVRNIGIVSLSARRDYNDPAQVLLFTRLINAGPEPISTMLTLFIDERPGSTKSVRLDPAESGEDGRASPGEAPATFSLELPGSAVLSVRHNTRDDLAADNTAAVILPPPARPRVLLVHGEGGPDPFLEELLEVREPAELRLTSEAAFETMLDQEADLSGRFDLAVFDRVGWSRPPGLPTVTFGAAPPPLEVVEPSGSGGGRRILSWQRQHPLMRHVSLDPIVFARFGGLKLPPEATALATGPDGPVIALFPAGGVRHVIVGFELQRSTFPMDVSFLVFMQNVVDYLTLGRSGRTSLAFRPGEAIEVRARDDADELRITGPVEAAVEVTPGASVTLPILRRVGLYTAAGAEPPHDRLALSVLSEVESDIRPRRRLLVNAEAARAGEAAAAAPRDLWPWIIAAALVLLVMEWLVYCRLARS
ncbi:MAG: VWA domain-containing protein [Planctomycetota bacterium]|nr:VWA domain-containing protein [Planctomycetota bacterium]